MKGATAEPWLNTTRPPNMAITIKRGSSQNFFRTRRKCQSSCRNSMSTPSEQMLHAVGVRPRRRTSDPVRLTGLASTDSQGIAPTHSHDQGGRKNSEEEDQAEQNRRHNVVHQLADSEP